MEALSMPLASLDELHSHTAPASVGSSFAGSGVEVTAGSAVAVGSSALVVGLAVGWTFESLSDGERDWSSVGVGGACWSPGAWVGGKAAGGRWVGAGVLQAVRKKAMRSMFKKRDMRLILYMGDQNGD